MILLPVFLQKILKIPFKKLSRNVLDTPRQKIFSILQTVLFFFQKIVLNVDIVFSIFSELKDIVLANDKKLLKIGLGVVTICGVGFIVYKIVKAYSQ